MELIRRKSAAQIAAMRRAGRVVAEIHAACSDACEPGTTTAELNTLAEDVLATRRARSNFRGYPGRSFAFPGVISTSVNDVVVHGIPSDAHELADGDIVSIDAGAVVDGWHADAAVTVGVGDISDQARDLIEAADMCLQSGIGVARVHSRVGVIGNAIERRAAEAGFAVVREYVGHGIGREMHEPPEIPNWGSPDQGIRLRSGMTLAIEPLVNAGRAETRLTGDGWTVVTADGSLSAHFEHSLAVGNDGPEILTVA